MINSQWLSQMILDNCRLIQRLPEYSIAWVMAADKLLLVWELSCFIIRGHNSSQHSNVANKQVMDTFNRYNRSGAYISENSIHHYLRDWAYLRQKSGQNTMKEWSEHKLNAIFELSTLENPYIDTLFNLIYEF